MVARRTITTMCPMNCLPTQCGMTVEVEGNQLIGIKGDQHNPDSRGFLCIRGRAAGEIFGNKQRLLHPLRRVGQRGEDRWEECSWDEALARIVGAIQETRPEHVGLWRGHGIGTTGPLGTLLVSRLGQMGGLQVWSPAIVCWAMGGYGLGLTGTLNTNTKEDMAANSRTIVLWGATFASQPDLAPHLVAARRRGAYVIHIDTRRTEASRHADEVLLVRPGSDAALALALAHVILAEGWEDAAFIAQHTVGFAALAEQVRECTPEWAAEITGISPERIRLLARRYATATPATIVLGGSSMYKHQHGWEPSRAISCLPALTGQLGIPGGGLGQRHGASPEGKGYADINAEVTPIMPAEDVIPNHMASMSSAMCSGRIDVLLMLGTNMLSGFADANQLARGLERIPLIVSYDLFMNATSRRYADLLLPATAWLEDTGLKQTGTHIYLMEQALAPAGECRPAADLLRELALRLNVKGFYPWHDQEDALNALLAAQETEEGKPLTVAELRRRGGYWQRSELSHVAYRDRVFATPSGKVEFWSERARQAGLSPLPCYTAPAGSEYPLRFCQGRTLSAFHSFFDEGQALPTLARANPEPELWIHPEDSKVRGIAGNDPIVVANQRGQFEALAHVTEDILPGVVWMRDGWSGVNRVTSGEPIVSVQAVNIVPGVPGGQSAYEAWVEVSKKPA
jgi:anaerobic selenocysteine-containing dehydrogenase